ncbi:hypothetical protein GOP47_0008262 [Adiantum capillus-veneris]|uniref:Uncharacterized protein n=1 Tax=Adiantum capillus-veneris TaxID=13818 RepID=A0A9D4UZE0_ADICA|nr:hypothetical protein GOP47_0008262 [Adiantum capillus-veneris]
MAGQSKANKRNGYESRCRLYSATAFRSSTPAAFRSYPAALRFDNITSPCLIGSSEGQNPMSHYNACIPKRPRGGQRTGRVNEGGLDSQESVPSRETSGLGGNETMSETQMNEDLGFMQLLQEDGWGGSLSEGQSIENKGLSQPTIPFQPSVVPGVSFIRPRPQPTSVSQLIP